MSNYYTSRMGKFFGYDHRKAGADGFVYDMENMTTADFPALSTRASRANLETWVNPQAITFCKDRFLGCANKSFWDDWEVMFPVSDGDKTFLRFQDDIIIFPDFIAYNPETKEHRSIEMGFTPEYPPEPIENTALGNGSDTDELVFTVAFRRKIPDFKVGDFVEITLEGLTKTKTVKAQIKGLVNWSPDPEHERPETSEGFSFPAGTFEGLEYTKRFDYTLKNIRKAIPELDFCISINNRLWGAKGRTIYASALGKPDTWIDYSGLAVGSWTADTAAGDDITAACVMQGIPVFFCENSIYKVYGDNPKNFGYQQTETIGIPAGEHKSLTVASGKAFYLSRRGFMTYSGGLPTQVSAALGSETFSDAVSASDGVRFWVSCIEQDDRKSLFAYDDQTGLWAREDETQILSSCISRGELCILSDKGQVLVLGQSQTIPGPSSDLPLRFRIETGDFTASSERKKGARRIAIRFSADDAVSAKVYIRRGCTDWSQIGEIDGYQRLKTTKVFDIPPDRADHFRIKIEGYGSITLYAISDDEYFSSYKE